MAITNRNLEPGTRLVAKYKGQTHVCVVEQAIGEDGPAKTVYALDGKMFKSPSAAGSAVMGGIACNGWRFWSVEGEAAEDNDAPGPEAFLEPGYGQDIEKAERLLAPHPNGQIGPKPKAKASAKVISRVPNQKGVEEGKTRFWCNGCMKSFVAEAGETPEACPEGHSAATLGIA